LKNKKKKILIYQLIKFRKMKNEKIIEVNLGVGLNQILPEVSKILIISEVEPEMTKPKKKTKKVTK